MILNPFTYEPMVHSLPVGVVVGQALKASRAAGKALAIPTQESHTTPGKVLKKARADGSEAPSPKKLNFEEDAEPAKGISEQETLPASASQVPNEVADTLPDEKSADTGATLPTDQVKLLQMRNIQLEMEKQVLEGQVAELESRIARMWIDEGPQGEDPGFEAEPGPVPASDDAARKRLCRICSPGAQGKRGW